jgi:hypothetical protein
LDPSKSKVDGLAFLGLCLARQSEQGHPDSVTHQEAFDLNQVLDRDYEFIFSTNDDGWLVGGGEPGPPKTYKLAAKDSAHVEIMRIGTYVTEWGGVSHDEIIKTMTSGEILIPQIEALPTAVVANPDKPPELEIRFDMEPEIPDFDDMESPLPINWQLRFLHNQLFKKFIFPSRFCPGAFHSTILRKAEFRSKEQEMQYFAKCEDAIQGWRKEGPKALNTMPRDVEGKPIESDQSCQSGLWLFLDRENPTHFFAPNFLPPYNTPEKRKIIMDVLKEEWDEKTLSWKPCGQGSMTKKRNVTPISSDDATDRGAGGVLVVADKPESNSSEAPAAENAPNSTTSETSSADDPIGPLIKRLETAIGGVVEEAMWHAKLGAQVICGDLNTVDGREEIKKNSQEST